MKLITSNLYTNHPTNQLKRYWYSNFSIEMMIEDQVAQDGLTGGPVGGRKIAFLSTPSLYFTMPEEIRKRCFVFDVSLPYVCACERVCVCVCVSA